MDNIINNFHSTSIFIKASVLVLCVGLLFHLVGYSTPYYRTINDPQGLTYEHEGLWLRCSFRNVGRGFYAKICFSTLFGPGKF